MGLKIRSWEALMIIEPELEVKVDITRLRIM